jgi:hypothetical protein
MKKNFKICVLDTIYLKSIEINNVYKDVEFEFTSDPMEASIYIERVHNMDLILNIMHLYFGNNFKVIEIEE